MKKNNLYGIGITLNLFQLILCLGIMGVRMLDVLGDFYIRVSVFALEVIIWMTLSMYLFIKHDLTGFKSSFKSAIIAIMPVALLTTVAALMGHFGNVSKADWLGFAFMGSSVSFYNKPAVILTEFIPVADGYLMFFANYAVLFVSSLIGSLMGSSMNNRIKKKSVTSEEIEEPAAQDMSMTQILEKIDENAMQGITDEEDEALSEVVLDEDVAEADEDTTTAVISIDDDDDDSEILGQETVEIISLDVDELEDEAEYQLKNRYNDIVPEEDLSGEAVTEAESEEIVSADEDYSVDADEDIFADIDEISDEEFEIVDQLYEEDIKEDFDTSFEEIMNFVEENITEDNGWTFLSEEESDELLKLAKDLPASDIDEEDDEEYEENETISFDEMMEIIMQEDLSDEPEDENMEEVSEEYSGEEISEAKEIKKYIDDYDTVISRADEYGIDNEFVDPFTEEIPEETEEIEEFEPAEEPEHDDDIMTEDIENADNISEMAEEINEEISGEVSDNHEDVIDGETVFEDAFAAAAEEIVEDFSDITLEDIENFIDIEIDEEDIYDIQPEESPVSDEKEEYLDIDEDIVVDFDVDEIISDIAEEEISEDGDDIDEEELKDMIRNGSADEEPEAENSLEEKDELDVIADFVRSVTHKEVDVVKVITEEPKEVKVKVKTQKDIKAQRDKEFDNWLNRKTARLDVKAIREALKETEEE